MAAAEMNTNAQPRIFRRLEPVELEAGYNCLMQTCAWLDGKRIRQWLRPLPRETYQRRHARGENFGLFAGDSIVAIVSLMSYIPDYWQDLIPEARITWMATLATQVHGRQVGRQTVLAAIKMLTGEKRLPIYLDCRQGYLERFYTDLGFDSLATRSFQPDPDFAFDATLMRLGSSAEDET